MKKFFGLALVLLGSQAMAADVPPKSKGVHAVCKKLTLADAHKHIFKGAKQSDIVAWLAKNHCKM